MPHQDLAQQTLVENSMLMLILEGLRNTLAWKVQDTGILNYLADTRVAGLHQIGVRLYFDLVA